MDVTLNPRLNELEAAHLIHTSGEPEGVEEIENALAHARRIGEQYGSALLAQTLGEIYLERGDLGHAISSLTDALDYYRRNAVRPRLSRTLELLANALERRGERERATAARAEKAVSQQVSRTHPKTLLRMTRAQAI